MKLIIKAFPIFTAIMFTVLPVVAQSDFCIELLKSQTLTQLFNQNINLTERTKIYYEYVTKNEFQSFNEIKEKSGKLGLRLPEIPIEIFSSGMSSKQSVQEFRNYINSEKFDKESFKTTLTNSDPEITRNFVEC